VPFLFAASLLAQTSSTISSTSTTSSTVVFSKPSTADAYTAAHPGAKLARAASGKLTFLNPDRSLTMMSGGAVSYKQNGLWAPSKLQVAALSDGSGWKLFGVPMSVSLTGSQGQVKDLSLNSGSVTMNFHLPQLSYNGDDTFTFQENGTTWLLRVAESSLNIEATVANRKGSVSHSLGYNSFGAALSVDAKGSLHIGGAVHVSPAHIVGADKKTYGVCSGWSQTSASVSFTCDDTKLPAAAFPYVIDPTFTGPSSYDPDYFSDELFGCCDSDEHWDENTWNARFDISSIPSNAVVTSVNVVTPSWSGGPGTESQGTPDCPYNGSDWTTNLGATWRELPPSPIRCISTWDGTGTTLPISAPGTSTTPVPRPSTSPTQLPIRR
jgi:hypothetical protein